MVSMSIRTFKDLLIGDWAIVGKRVAVKWSILVKKQKSYVKKPVVGVEWVNFTAIMSDLLSFAICSSNVYI